MQSEYSDIKAKLFGIKSVIKLFTAKLKKKHGEPIL